MEYPDTETAPLTWLDSLKAKVQAGLVGKETAVLQLRMPVAMKNRLDSRADALGVDTTTLLLEVLDNQL